MTGQGVGGRTRPRSEPLQGGSLRGGGVHYGAGVVVKLKPTKPAFFEKNTSKGENKGRTFVSGQKKERKSKRERKIQKIRERKRKIK